MFDDALQALDEDKASETSEEESEEEALQYVSILFHFSLYFHNRVTPSD